MKNYLKVLILNVMILSVLITISCSNIFEASAQGDLRRVEKLVKGGADVNSKSGENSMTPLSIASSSGKLDVVKYLIDNGADINLASFDGKTPLMHAVINNHLDVVKYLITKGANVNLKDKEGATALNSYDLKEQHFEIVKVLVESGADINTTNYSKWTPLLWSADKGYTEIFLYLLQKGANPLAKNCNGSTAIELAIHWDRKDIINILTDKGFVQEKAEVDEYETDSPSTIYTNTVNVNTNLTYNQVENNRNIYNGKKIRNWKLSISNVVSDTISFNVPGNSNATEWFETRDQYIKDWGSLNKNSLNKGQVVKIKKAKLTKGLVSFWLEDVEFE